MLPTIVPIVQLKLLAAVAANVILGLVALHILAVDAFVTAGVGLTVTVIVYKVPTQLPVTDVGVIKYCTEPDVALLGLVSTSLIVPPLDALAPVIPPVIVPIVHVYVLGVLTVNDIFGLVLLQILEVAEFVTTGLGLTVTVIVVAVPAQLPIVAVGVT